MNFKIINFNKDTGQAIIRFDGYSPMAITLPIEDGRYLVGEHLETYIESFRPFVDVSRQQLLKDVSNQEEIDILVELEEVDSETIKQEALLRRNRLLIISDYTQLGDSTLREDQKEAFASYRQLLRDIPQQPNFPTKIIWPNEPVISSAPITPVVTIG
jgi:hypothetical protein